MTELLKEAITVLEALPEHLQDTAARQIIRCVEELSTFDDSSSLTAPHED